MSSSGLTAASRTDAAERKAFSGASPQTPSVDDAQRDIDDEARSILSTLNDDGSRKWLCPKPSPGRFLTRRRIVAYLLIALFVALPFIHVNGRPLILLDLITRRFHIFGTTFYPTDTLLLALLLVGTFLTIFWLTALFGRVWCGWACPQTVYMEFLYRPIERLFEGTPGRAKSGWLQTSGVGKILKYVVYLAASLALAHTFLAYFVSWDHLRNWVFGSPFDHPVGFGVVMVVTAAMMFDFGYFREQVCLVACPYGRMQSALLDRHSMIVTYDFKRGEPRGKKPKKDVALNVLSAQPSVGDCVDCRLCVTTCPTGIDIRNGLQMECVNCTQCIDACDAVMTKLGRATGLIRYSSKSRVEGEKFKVLRPRVILYPLVLTAIASLFFYVLAHTGVADVTVLRGLGQPFVIMPSTEIENAVRVKVVNRTETPAEFNVTLEGVPNARFVSQTTPLTVAPGQMLTTAGQIFVPFEVFKDGKASITLHITGPEKFEKRVPFTLIGPYSLPKTDTPKHDGSHDDHMKSDEKKEQH